MDDVPSSSGAIHSKVILKRYGSVNLAGFSRTTMSAGKPPTAAQRISLQFSLPRRERVHSTDVDDGHAESVFLVE